MADRHEINKDELNILRSAGPENCSNATCRQQNLQAVAGGTISKLSPVVEHASDCRRRNMQVIAGGGTCKRSPMAQYTSDCWQQNMQAITGGGT